MHRHLGKRENGKRDVHLAKPRPWRSAKIEPLVTPSIPMLEHGGGCIMLCECPSPAGKRLLDLADDMHGATKTATLGEIPEAAEDCGGRPG